MAIPILQGQPASISDREKRSLPLNVHIEPVTASTSASYRRLITLLLPIRYSDKFYKDSVANTSDSSLARVSIWQDASAHINGQVMRQQVVGGIQCRLEEIPLAPVGELQLYVQTIGVLAPYRQLGIATQLLEDIIATVVQHYGKVTSIYAHVWEANTDALEWYAKRGFSIEEQVVEGYYRKLKPSRAKVVRRRINVQDHLAARDRCVVPSAEVAV